MKRRVVLPLALAGVFSASGFAFAQGDPQSGQRAFAQCVACHSVEPGENRVGPSLHGVLDQPAGHVEDFSYSNALRDSGLTWDEETLTEFLQNPRTKVPGTTMAFVGIRDESRIADLIAYLRQVSEE